MIPFTRRAEQQLADLRDHYEDLGRIEAILNLLAAVEEASDVTERDPTAGLPAPRPYPQLARPGWAWIKARRYWFACGTTPALVITAVFYENEYTDEEALLLTAAQKSSRPMVAGGNCHRHRDLYAAVRTCWSHVEPC